jgi:hypothetical protein
MTLNASRSFWRSEDIGTVVIVDTRRGQAARSPFEIGWRDSGLTAPAENGRARTLTGRLLRLFGNVFDRQMGIGVATRNGPLLGNEQFGISGFQVQQISDRTA